MKEYLVLRVITKLLLPFILLFGLYVQFHGDFGPGGGFQAGVIFAAGFILYAMVYGVKAARKVLPIGILRGGIAGGLLLYALVGVANLMLGENYLNYTPLAESMKEGQHLGIFLVELGVGITVASVMMTVFFTFATWRED
ncbi:MAG: Na(+)/H(+) antiporter subunit B [Pseudomonadota bacterium]|nr:Na(+)/H(+) antiporter subunit B [Pseudomonadota bacterium]MEC8461673.1 Na(+)/H(+) antiporter subunit B [Pseudomonadota bacterium]MEC8532050.1 Na(+)/H(+) antiporter subunit B [Pseudomonadota bacterium]MEC8726646.1 Na(+)/H(+) antiporter subunit B [Pseudomonadota bacterium]